MLRRALADPRRALATRLGAGIHLRLDEGDITIQNSNSLRSLAQRPPPPRPEIERVPAAVPRGEDRGHEIQESGGGDRTSCIGAGDTFVVLSRAQVDGGGSKAELVERMASALDETVPESPLILYPADRDALQRTHRRSAVDVAVKLFGDDLDVLARSEAGHRARGGIIDPWAADVKLNRPRGCRSFRSSGP